MNWKGVAIAGAVIVAGLLYWGFSAGVSKFWADQIPAENTETQSPVQPIEPEIDNSSEEPVNQSVADADADIMLEELATYGSDSWTVDPYLDLSPYATSILLGGECAVWFFPDVETRNIVIDAGDFDLGYTYYYMAAGEAWDRVVLVADSEYSTCAVDASYMLGWDLSTFEHAD